MTEFDIRTKVKSYSFDELNSDYQHLVNEARAMTKKSYAPYSHFHVGAAILLSNGEIITGANQENAAFPSGTCAERTAAFYAHTQYPQAQFMAIAIAASDANGEVTAPIAPCGACRQVLLEYEKLAGHDLKVLLTSSQTIYELQSVKSLLPLAFSDF